jgi:hypothetical protein
MPEYLRVFVIIVVIGSIAFGSARAAISEVLIDPEDYKRRRNFWFAITFLAFLSHSFWLFIFGTLALAYVGGRREHNPLALYFMMLLAVPGFSQPLPGFGGINLLFIASHETMLSLGLLLPAAIHLYRSGEGADRSLRVLDQLVLCYAAWVAFRHYSDGGITEGVRAGFYQLVDLILPYYVASRFFRSMRQFQDTMTTFVIVVVVAGAIAAFEAWRGWLLYTELRYPLGLPQPSYIVYLQRGSLGLMRAQSSLNHPIVVGYVMMLGIGMLTMLSKHVNSRLVYNLALASIGGGLIGALSRGPWLGAAVMLMMIVALDPSVGRRVSRTVTAALVVMVVLFATPLGSTVIDLLPWVGTVEAENVDYRTRLFEVSMDVMALNLWQGDLGYLENPMMEEMRQGQGIIDVTNSYLEIALPYGLIGLILFVLPFVICIQRLRRALRTARSIDADSERLGRTLLAMIFGVLATIATVSGIGVIPELYWVLIGMSASFVIYAERLTKEAGEEGEKAAVPAGRSGRRLSEGY